MSLILKRLKLLRPLTCRFLHRKLCGPKPTPLYNIRIACPEDYERILRFMASTYCNTEPILVNLGLAGKPPIAHLKMLRKIILQGLTLFAEDERSGCVVGASLNALSVPHDVKAMREIACSQEGLTRDLFHFYAFVIKDADVWEKFCHSPVFECGHLCVHPEHGGQGLAQRLVLDSWTLARDMGLRVFVIHCSSNHTINLAEKLGMLCVSSIKYCDHFFDDKFVFNYVQEPHTELKTFVSDLHYYKSYYLKK